MNFKLLLQYDGTDFHGWQTQTSLRTVQGELTQALSRLEGRAVVVHGAGRTDAGVHAEGQVAHVHLQRDFTPPQLRAAINGNVGRDLRVLRVEPVSDDFHARYSAQGKTYCYRVFNERFQSPFLLRYTHHEARPLNLEEMQHCARLFVGTYDWTAFSCAQTNVESRVRCVTELTVSEHRSRIAHGRLIEITASAEGFLRYMVRSIAGTLLEVGRGALDPLVVQRAIEIGDRTLAGATAPARGLTLKQVFYDEDV